MTKQVFLSELKKRLSHLKASERKRILSYYSELISDMVEEGMTEEEAINSLGNIEDIVCSCSEDANDTPPKSPTSTTWIIILAVIGCPIWIPLLCAVVAILIAILAVILSVIIAIASCMLALLVSGICLSIGGVVLAIEAFPAGAFALGAGLIVLGIWALLMMPAIILSKLIIKSTISMLQRVFHRK